MNLTELRNPLSNHSRASLFSPIHPAGGLSGNRLPLAGILVPFQLLAGRSNGAAAGQESATELG